MQARAARACRLPARQHQHLRVDPVVVADRPHAVRSGGHTAIGVPPSLRLCTPTCCRSSRIGNCRRAPPGAPQSRHANASGWGSLRTAAPAAPAGSRAIPRCRRSSRRRRDTRPRRGGAPAPCRAAAPRSRSARAPLGMRRLGIVMEVRHLSEHRTDAGALEDRPLHHLVAAAHVAAASAGRSSPPDRSGSPPTRTPRAARRRRSDRDRRSPGSCCSD